MDSDSQALMRASLHDLANVLAGLQGILDLSDPDQPLSARDRARLEALLEDGLGTLDRSRHLAMETVPHAEVESGNEWRHHLSERLKPLATMFRKQFELRQEGDLRFDQWPGERLLGGVAALARQTLPFCQGEKVEIRMEATATEWRLSWPQVSAVPENLVPGAPVPKDISGRWFLRIRDAMNAHLQMEDHGLTLRIPRS